MKIIQLDICIIMNIIKNICWIYVSIQFKKCNIYFHVYFETVLLNAWRKKVNEYNRPIDETRNSEKK